MKTDKNPLERIADALERIASDPVVEYEFGPPLCPHCGMHDPIVRTPALDEGEGNLSHIIIKGICQNCHNSLFAVVESYSMHRTIETVKAEVENRKLGEAGNGKVSEGT